MKSFTHSSFRFFFLTALLAVFVAACNRSDSIPPAFKVKDYLINEMYGLTALDPMDTTINHLVQIAFDCSEKASSNSNSLRDTIIFFSADFSIHKNTHVFAVRYAPMEPLLDSFDKTDIGLIISHFGYQMNKKLAGKELFEIYDTTAHRLDSRIFAGQSMSISGQSMSIWMEGSKSVNAQVFHEDINYCFLKIRSSPFYYIKN